MNNASNAEVHVNWNEKGKTLSLAGEDVGNNNKITTHGTGITYRPGTDVASVDKIVFRKSDPPGTKRPCVVTTDTELTVEKTQGGKTKWTYTLWATTSHPRKVVRLDPIWEDDP